MIKAVIFDMFETLITLFVGRIYFSEDIATDLGLPVEDFRREWHKTENFRSTGKYSIEEALAVTLKNMSAYSEEKVLLVAKKRRESLADTFSAMPQASLQLLQALHEKGIKIGLITNTFSDEYEMIKASKLFPFFDSAMISYEQGILKPDPAIYKASMSALNVKPEECLYVGDGGSRELFAAREIGMKALQCTWFHDLAFEPHIPCPLLEDFPHVNHQLEVLNYLDS